MSRFGLFQSQGRLRVSLIEHQISEARVRVKSALWESKRADEMPRGIGLNPTIGMVTCHYTPGFHG
jgi:hypothetical protein